MRVRVRPGTEDLLPARQVRKATQLESLDRPAVALATVVDFCTGGGQFRLAHLPTGKYCSRAISWPIMAAAAVPQPQCYLWP